MPIVILLAAARNRRTTLPTKKSKPFQACVLDIETTALEAVGAGVTLCAVVKPFGGAVKVFRVDVSDDELGNEVNLLTRLFKELEKYDLVVGHNVEQFDFQFLKTRARVLGIPFTYRPMVYDTLKGFRRTGFRTVLNGFGKPTASLDMVVDMFDKKQKKTKLYPHYHWKTVWGSPSERRMAMRDLVDHCVKDVCMNEEIFWDVYSCDWNPVFKRVR